MALSRFMSEIIIGNIRHSLGREGRWERRGSRWRGEEIVLAGDDEERNR